MFKFRFCKRKLSREGSGETLFESHSSAMGRKKSEVRFLYGQFAAQRMNFKNALKVQKSFQVEFSAIFLIEF
jgi:hypothetical protein